MCLCSLESSSVPLEALARGAVLAAGAVTLLKVPFLGPDLAGAAATALQMGQELM